jgi:hypothetical protein
VYVDTTDAAIAVSQVSTLGRGAYSARKMKMIYIKWKMGERIWLTEINCKYHAAVGVAGDYLYSNSRTVCS